MSEAVDVRKPNVGDVERIASIAVGSFLLLSGLRKRSVWGWGSALAGGGLIWRGVSGHCAVYGAAGFDSHPVLNQEVSGRDLVKQAPVIESSITIGRSAEELYDLWRAPESLKKIMAHFAEVEAVDGPELTRWRLKHSPLGATIEWDSELTVQNRGTELGWASQPGTTLPNEGTVTFRPAPADRGTEVHVRFRFQPPLPTASIPVAKAFDSIPRAIASASLRHLKNLAETGEIPTLAQNSSARGSSDSF